MRLAALLTCLMLGLLAALSSRPATAAARIALVIGNDDYPNLPATSQLKKAANDAGAVGDALEKLGFSVLRGSNLDRKAMVETIFNFTQSIRPGDTAAFFFAGHGISVGGGNLLLPADIRAAEPGQEALIRNMAIAEADIIADIQERKAGVTLVILDACRNNPFQNAGITRSVGSTRGLARVPEAQGVFAIYSAGYGQAALDSLGSGDASPNSVFTRVLAPALARPNVHLADMIIDVRQEVARLARGIGYDQNPAYYDQTQGGRIYLSGGEAEAKPPVPEHVAVVAPPLPATPPADRRGSVGRVWYTREGDAGWTGTWTRRGTTDTFDSIQFDPTGTYFDISTSEMSIENGRIHVVRRAPRAVCIYDGQLDPSGTKAKGTYGCNNIDQQFDWDARIENVEPAAPSNDPRGQVWAWNDPGGWSGLVKRRGVSSIFDAVWRSPRGGIDMAPLYITVAGNEVTALRDQDKGRCTYRGRLARDRVSIRGRAVCDWAPQGFDWNAKVLN